MGTLRKPGSYDCIANLHPDEPYFVLQGRDPVAASLVRLWTISRANYRLKATLPEKLLEAGNAALEMQAWCETYAGRSPADVLTLLPTDMLVRALELRGIVVAASADAVNRAALHSVGKLSARPGEQDPTEAALVGRVMTSDALAAGGVIGAGIEEEPVEPGSASIVSGRDSANIIAGAKSVDDLYEPASEASSYSEGGTPD